jgi:flagellar basal body rod protein FlgG
MAMDGIAWAASAMAAARARLEIAANNIANLSTGGFKALAARGRLSSHGVEIDGVPARSRGALVHTGRDSDRAIVGEGTFLLRGSDGRIVETRNGAFTRGVDGKLRDDSGRILVGTRLRPGSSVRDGWLEGSNVDAIGEMVRMLSASRSFESAEKCVAAIDQTREKAASDVAKVA